MTAALPVVTADLLRERSVVTESGCWEFQGPDNGNGYRIYKREYAHRLAHEVFIGPIPEGLQIDHLCRNRACCNPEHLEAVTPQENHRRAFAAKTECKHGHPLPPFVPGQNRPCAPCHAARVAKARQRIADGERPPVAITQHGTTSSYSYGCRCDLCRQANALAARQLRAQRRALSPLPVRVPKPPTCGTRHAYNSGCRCDLCRQANRLGAQRTREKKRAA